MKNLKEALITKKNIKKVIKDQDNIFILVPDHEQDRAILAAKWYEISENIAGNHYDLAYIVRGNMLDNIIISLAHPNLDYWYIPVTKMKIEKVSEIIQNTDLDSDDWYENFQQINIRNFI